MMIGKLVVLSGPGGVGKSTISREVRKDNRFWLSVSYTTRAARANEVDGLDYHFISAGKFDFIPKLISKSGFKSCFKGVTIKPGRPILLSKLKNKNKLGQSGTETEGLNHRV